MSKSISIIETLTLGRLTALSVLLVAIALVAAPVAVADPGHDPRGRVCRDRDGDAASST